VERKPQLLVLVVVERTYSNKTHGSKLVLLKQNIGISGEDSIPLGAKSLNLLLIEEGVL